MADSKLSEMTAATSPVAGDVKLYGVQSAAGVAVTARQLRAVPIRGITGATTLATTDAGACVRSTGSSAAAVTVDTGAWVVGDVVQLRRAGTGALTVTAGSGVTINTPAGHTAEARAQGSSLALHYVATDEWDLTGDLA